MTTAQHLALAILAGHRALDDGSSVGMLELWGTTAAHHGLLAQECELCANMRRRMPPAIRERMACSECGGAGWIARAT